MIGGIIFYGIFTFIGIILLLYLLSLDNAVLMEVLKKYIDSGKGATIKTTAIIAFICFYLYFFGKYWLYNIFVYRNPFTNVFYDRRNKYPPPLSA